VTATEGRTRRAEALPPEERRRRIVDATLPLLLEHGEMVTTKLVAEAAGIAEGTIFRVFADKDELIAAVVDRAYDPAPIEEALAAIDAGGRLEDALATAVALLQRRMLVLSRLMASVGPRFHRGGPLRDRPALVALFEAHRDEITVEPAAAARWLVALTMATSHPMTSPEPMAPERVVHLFLHGVGRAPTSNEEAATC
jgi:AcrR family transcriptional regulator